MGLFERLKLSPAGNLGAKKLIFLRDLLDRLLNHSFLPLSLTVILQFRPILHCMLIAPQKHGILMVKLVAFFR